MFSPRNLLEMQLDEDPIKAFNQLLNEITSAYADLSGGVKKKVTIQEADAKLLSQAKAEASKKSLSITQLQKTLRNNNKRSDRDKRQWEQQTTEITNVCKNFNSKWSQVLIPILSAWRHKKVRIYVWCIYRCLTYHMYSFFAQRVDR